ncbi:luciferin 4-monooxygenase isoform X2 [Apis florea]|uniref:luciferin 4-monooxygenase isoform X2 n=1 Tax=Apis florea TaxID=7463 RepID=UPI0012FE85A9|nr:luciferin 4-monooxygenase isoform X2 [Apis florea]
MNINENNIIYSKPISEVPNISLGQYLFNNLYNNPNDIAQIDVETGKRFTRKEILDKSVRLSIALRNYGIKLEDRISLTSENHPNYMIAMCGIFFNGITFSPLNPAYTEREFSHMLKIYQPRVIFVSRRTEKLLVKVASTLSWDIKLIELDDEALDGNVVTLNVFLEKYGNMVNPCMFTPVQVDDNSKRMAVILCSSGTTGFPKGVMLSHRNLLVFIQSIRKPSYLYIQQDDRMIIFLPLFHGYAFGMMCICICSNTITCLMRDYNTDTLLNSIDKYKITHLPVVPPVLVAILKHPMLSNYDFSSVKEILCGALPLPLDIANELKRRTKVKHIRNGYGMTELTVVSNLSERTRKDASIGPPLPGFKCKVVSTETGRTVGPGQVGEICFAGDQIMLGYYKNPKSTAETIDEGNWLHTGDLGYFTEDGGLYVTGRIKEIIRYKGFQVAPSEIETLLLTLPSVKDVAVLGKPDEVSGELPMAVVVRQPGQNVTAEEIVDFVKSEKFFAAEVAERRR